MAFRLPSRRVRRMIAARTPRTRHKIYLCNWFVKLVKPGRELLPNQVQCHVPMKMTKFDIRNYFQNIYGVKVAQVDTRIQLGFPAFLAAEEKLESLGTRPNLSKERRILPANVREKKPDVKVAYLTLAEQTFEFPDLFGRFSRDQA